MNQGQRVRLKSAPDKIGVLTGEVQTIRGRQRLMVQFPDTAQFFPEQNLELVEDNPTHESLIVNGNYGGTINLRGAITHSRLTGRLADVIYSMEATNTEFFPYQFKPVLNFLESPSNGILIADEVGLGKTIEAGLIWTELRARVDANRLLILCPAVLKDKWQEELLHRFGIRADPCNARELLDKLKENEEYRDSGFALIASTQGTRPPKDWEEDESNTSGSAQLARYISNQSAERDLFDCVIIDEAHYLRNPESQTHQLGHLIRAATSHIVLLSATPIQMRSDDLFHLLNIIDNENFEYKQTFDDLLNANKPIITLASALRANQCQAEHITRAARECLQNPLLKGNRQLTSLLEYPPTPSQLKDVNYRISLANRIERINLLGSVITRTRKRDVQGKKVIRDPKAETIPMSSVEFEFYQAITEAVRDYCQQYELFDGFMLTVPQRQLCSSMPAALRAWQNKIVTFENDLIFDTTADLEKKLPDTHVGPLVQRLASIAKEIGSYEVLKEHDSKYKKLKKLLVSYWNANPGRKVILFSYYRETIRYLQERLQEDQIESVVLMGGENQGKAEKIERFRNANGPRILLATEVLSEGVDLQFSSTLINYDLPWNPMRVEQRIGRIDRIGQEKEKIIIWNFFYKDTLDDRVYHKLFKRLDIFQQALGDMEAVLGSKIRSLTYELLSHDLTKQQEISQIEQTASAIANEKQLQEKLEEEAAGLAAHGDYVLNRVTAAREMRRFIDGNHLWVYIRDFLKDRYPGCKMVKTSSSPLKVNIELSIEAKSAMQVFLDKNPLLSRTRLARSNTGESIICCFSNTVDFGNTKYEVINQSHSLVRFVASQINVGDFHPVVASEIGQHEIPSIPSGTYLILCKRWSTSGARTVEKLVYKALNLKTGCALSGDDAERLVNVCVDKGEDWLNVNTEIIPDHAVNSYHELELRFDDEFFEYCHAMQLENEDRVNFLINTLKGKIEKDIQSRRQAIEKLKINNNDKMIKLNEGLIKKIKENSEQKIIQFNQNRKINTEPSDVILNLIKVK
ncbi:DEAD/DEAH box helicase family protein [Thalassotalea sp. G20_0]|uniref:SNF2-related protein n=1 Tax=Thalassotalea sp. G20_0 TaxID=2821093 RepID=UPI001ADA82B6|nr:SNF2-related protein [Thalassotalea sp. G20_0]MBO9495397.1 DEAD/DEAH box helicase family protein [Thalassotalea sp. G20_0]